MPLSNLLRFESRNLSWWVAQAFTWGSVVWVINGFAAFLPFCNSHFETAAHSTGWTAFLGATIFEVGSVVGILEYWNRDDVRDSVSGDGEKNDRTPDEESNSHLHTQPSDHERKDRQRRVVWFSTDMRYFRQPAWYGAFFQLLAASIFWISGFTAIPEIQSSIKENTPLIDGVYWAPQVIGGTGFMISATFLMLVTQETWWKPRPSSIGWQVGVWNLIGGLGFMLSGAFGFSSSEWAKYQSALTTFWGGWAFLIGSLFQWYGSVNPDSKL